MKLLFSPRDINPSNGSFSKDPGSETHYIETDRDKGAKANDRLAFDDWVAKIRSSAGSEDVLIWVHGFNTRQSRAIARQRTITSGLQAAGYRGAVIGFDWPSEGGGPFSYPSDLKDAAEVAEFLSSDGILPLPAALPGHRIHILAHSMGAYLSLLSLGKVANARVDEMLFAAADYDAVKMAAGIPAGQVVDVKTARLTNYLNTKDAVLNLATGSVQGGDERLGRAGLPTSPPVKAQDLDCTPVYDAHVDPKGFRISHTWYSREIRFYRDAVRVLAGEADAGMPTRDTDPVTGARRLKP
ncbi:MAG: alpha/beta fold hydrolase [Pseudomonadota bacterium]